MKIYETNYIHIRHNFAQSEDDSIFDDNDVLEDKDKRQRIFWRALFWSTTIGLG